MGVGVWPLVSVLGQQEGVAVAAVVVLVAVIAVEEGNTVDLAGMESSVELCMEDTDLVEDVHQEEIVAVQAVVVQVVGSGRSSVWPAEAVVAELLPLLGAIQA